MSELYDFLNSINHNKVNLYETGNESAEALDKAYPPFVVNRCLAAHFDLVLIINELNIRGGNEFAMEKRSHYEFLLSAVPVKKRFAKLPKPEKNDRIELLKTLNNWSTTKALEVVDILTDAQYKQLEELLIEGGSSRAPK